jgi:hypothetical protein
MPPHGSKRQCNGRIRRRNVRNFLRTFAYFSLDPIVRLCDVSPRSQVAAGLGVLLLVTGVLLHPHYLATGLFIFTGMLVLVAVVLTQPSFARLITSISPAPWPPQSARGWFGAIMFSLAVAGMVAVIALRLLYAHTI